MKTVVHLGLCICKFTAAQTMLSECDWKHDGITARIPQSTMAFNCICWSIPVPKGSVHEKFAERTLHTLHHHPRLQQLNYIDVTMYAHGPLGMKCLHYRLSQVKQLSVGHGNKRPFTTSAA